MSGYDANEQAHGMYDQGYRGMEVEEFGPRFRDDEIDYDERSWSGYTAARPSYGGSMRGAYGAGIGRHGPGYEGRGEWGGYGGQMRGREGETDFRRGSWRGEGWGGERYAGGVGGPSYEHQRPGSQQFQDSGADTIGYGYGGQPTSHTGKGPRGYKRSDERIREDVCERLTEHHEVDAREVDVDVKNGEVTLTGTTSDRRQKLIAEQIVESVSGVIDVHNQIRIRREGDVDTNAQNVGGGQNGRRTATSNTNTNTTR